MTMLASAGALLLASIAFVLYELITFRSAMVRGLTTEAQIVGWNSVTALTFADPQSAEATLKALSAEPSIRSAGLYDRRGRLFASFQQGGTAHALALHLAGKKSGETHQFDGPHLALSHPIVFDGDTVGTVEIQADLDEMYSRFRQFAAIGTVVVAASLLIALLLSERLQRSISGTVLHLAQTARAISDRKDYSVRATPPEIADELALLTDTFNNMLTEIGSRNQALESARHELELELGERKRAEEQVRHLNDNLEKHVAERTAELEASNKELEAFSYSVSHDLRAPLRAIDGFSRILLEDYGNLFDDQAQDQFNRIRKASQRMGILIDALLNLAKLSRKQVERRSMDLSELADGVIAELRRNEPQRQVQVAIEPGLRVNADVGLTRVLLDNLIGNAWKFTRKSCAPRIEFRAVQNGGGTKTYMVRDNGAGFDMAYANKLFGAFQRLHDMKDFEGTGIGLATVQRIVRRHGGRVWAEGGVNKGASFYFTL